MHRQEWALVPLNHRNRRKHRAGPWGYGLQAQTRITVPLAREGDGFNVEGRVNRVGRNRSPVLGLRQVVEVVEVRAELKPVVMRVGENQSQAGNASRLGQ